MPASASPAQRRYGRRVLILSIAYVALLLPAVYLLDRHLVTGPLVYFVGVVPALPVIGFFVAIGAYLVEEGDEYLRMLLVRQALVATGFALSVCTVWGFLEGVGVPHLPAYYAAVVWFSGLGLGGCVNALIERRAA